MRLWAIPAAFACIIIATTLSPTGANTTQGFGCRPLYDGGLAAQVCTSATHGNASGRLLEFTGKASGIHLTLSRCDESASACTALANATTAETPGVAAKAGKYFRTCAVFVLKVTAKDRHSYSECSPVVQATT
jgi:hypothetical protein